MPVLMRYSRGGLLMLTILIEWKEVIFTSVNSNNSWLDVENKMLGDTNNRHP